MPSGVRKFPPHAKPYLRKICTTVQFIRGTQPRQLLTVFMSMAWPHECRLTEPPVVPPAGRTSRGP